MTEPCACPACRWPLPALPIDTIERGPDTEQVTSTAAKKLRSPHQPTGQWIRSEKRLALYLRDEFRCLYCGTNLKGAAPADVTLDHLLPKSAGGSNDATNLITACRPCNSSRQDKPWVDFATGGAIDRIRTRIAQPLNIPLAKALIAGTAGDPELENR